MERKAEEIARCLGVCGVDYSTSADPPTPADMSPNFLSPDVISALDAKYDSIKLQSERLVADELSNIVSSNKITESRDDDDDDDDDDARGSGDIINSTSEHNDGSRDDHEDMWHLRSLAIQQGGLLNSRSRKLGWIKLAGVEDDLVSHKGTSSPQEDDGHAYEEIQTHLEQRMETSRWHIQRELRRIRKDKQISRGRSGSTASYSSSTSSICSSKSCTPSTVATTFDSGSSTPVAANPPKSVTFEGIDYVVPSDASPLSMQYLQSTQFESSHESILRKPTPFKRAVKKDRRPQERKLLVQIATSAFYLLQRQEQNESLHLQCYPGMQDLIAVLLLHLESPSLTSLLLKQIMKSHLWTYCTAATVIDPRDRRLASSPDCVIEDIHSGKYTPGTSGNCSSNKVVGNLDILSLSFFPLLQIIDEEFHATLLIDDEQDFLNNRVLVFEKVLRSWISCWFSCHDVLPLEVISRVVDLFLASHPSMPM